MHRRDGFIYESAGVQIKQEQKKETAAGSFPVSSPRKKETLSVSQWQ